MSAPLLVEVEPVAIQIVLHHASSHRAPGRRRTRLTPVATSGAPQQRVSHGCSFFVDQISHLSHLHARNTSLVLVSRAPLANIRRYRKRMGWTVPWFSSAHSDFNRDFGLTTERGETFGLSVFPRDGRSVYRTYFTTNRGVEALGSTWTFLDLTPLGRQETWEDFLKGWPQTPPYEWWRRHDEYEM